MDPTGSFPGCGSAQHMLLGDLVAREPLDLCGFTAGQRAVLRGSWD